MEGYGGVCDDEDGDEEDEDEDEDDDHSSQRLCNSLRKWSFSAVGWS